MKNPGFLRAGILTAILISAAQSKAQEAAKGSNFSVGADIYSNYIWRGSRFGQGPHIQPTVKYCIGGLTAGVWGSFDINGYSEADPFISYYFPFGLSLGLTDYYNPDLSVFEISVDEGSHAFEINAGYSLGSFTLNANYILNKAGMVGSAGGDIYIQAGLVLREFDLFLGAGSGWHTTDGEFDVCNIGIGTTRSIGVTDKFSIPVTGQVVFNPDRERLYLVIGFSF